ncbi:hypothetical protein [Halorhabdus rudnickae]|uniref:hypothetical protein n=1 Tax=Halorhabdus rudnickae TaxID=1775544 RepID=UPI001083C39D|nr:hypothetical protein [Halorhabdus rudnickae]
MTDKTLFGLDRSTLNSASWVAAIGIFVLLFAGEEWLRGQDLGAVAMVLYIALGGVVLLDLVISIQRWRKND